MPAASAAPLLHTLHNPDARVPTLLGHESSAVVMAAGGAFMMMDLNNLEATSREEVNAELLRLLANRQALDDVSSELIMLDYRPDFAKLDRRGSCSLGHVEREGRMAAVWGTYNGLNLDNLLETSDEEIDAFLNDARKGRGPLDPGPLYNMTANSLWLYTRPDFAKLHRRMLAGWSAHKLEPIITAASFSNLHAYINQGWEIGIENCTRGLQMRGVSKAQLMETIMHAQLSGAGIRGLECCFRALGIILGDYVERAEPARFPDGWAPDMPAFYCGLDPTTRELTPEDQRAIEDWYERTIGEVPRWVRVLARVDPISLKGHRARWEGCFRGALPKQMMPYLSIYHHTIVGNREGLREAVLLGKAWGMGNAYIINTAIMAAYYFTGVERVAMLDDTIVDALTAS